ncbi:MAG: peptidase T [Clostridia bacterium]|nr:peptidase T [Clostridia bacterium]
MKAYERLLQYVKIHTTSDEDSQTTPSSERQFALADMLRDELVSLGVSDAQRDKYAYVYGHIPASPGKEDAPAIGLIAHIDTAPDFSGENVRPVLHPDYDGKDVVLGESGRVLSVKDFPDLQRMKGRTLITTDGTTLLGADDKAGVAEIMTLAERIIGDGIPHGKICIAFTPDEEIGAGADHFDVARFGADFAYTVDGGLEGGIEYENFNAAAANVTFLGVNVHPGSAKDIMVNAQLLAMEFNRMLPQNEIPSKTEGYEGFYHLTRMSGSVEKAVLQYIIRDHDEKAFLRRKETVLETVKMINQKYNGEYASAEIREQYRNMLEMVRPHMHLIDTAKLAAKDAGAEPFVSPIRGGTDGARLSFMGLPCPNLGTGGSAYHGPFEHISVEGMDIVTGMLIRIIERYALTTRKQLGI